MTDTRLPPQLQPFRRPVIRGQAKGVTLFNLHLLPREGTGRDKPKGCKSFCPHVSHNVFSVSSPTQPDVSSQKNGVRKTSDRAFVETAALLPTPQRVS